MRSRWLTKGTEAGQRDKVYSIFHQLNQSGGSSCCSSFGLRTRKGKNPYASAGLLESKVILKCQY